MTQEEIIKLARKVGYPLVEYEGTPYIPHLLAVLLKAAAAEQRTWVGLTAKEKHEFRYSHMTTADFIEVIEAKLKDKNTRGQE